MENAAFVFVTTVSEGFTGNGSTCVFVSFCHTNVHFDYSHLLGKNSTYHLAATLQPCQSFVSVNDHKIVSLMSTGARKSEEASSFLIIQGSN